MATDPEARYDWTAALGGHRLLLAGWRALHMMDLNTGLTRKVKSGSEAADTSLAFSANCKMFASASGDGRIHIWETTTLKERCQFRGLETGIVPLAFSPKALTLASGSTDTTILLWDLPGIVTGRVPAGKLTPQDLETAWGELASTDAAKAYQAMGRMLAQSSTALAYLKEQIKPAEPVVEQAVIDRMVKDLASEKFAVRDKATTELAKLGDAAEGALRKALKEQSILEVRQRLEKLLRKIEEMNLDPPPERLRLMRAVEVVENLGTDGMPLLKSWAGGAPGALLTRQAQQALDK
jgi:hypothetical protein